MRKTVIVISTLLLVVNGCEPTKKKQSDTIDDTIGIQDTIVAKQRNVFNQSWQIDVYSKSYSYYWLVGKDTVDFIVRVNEYKRDTTLSIRVFHKEPILFATVLEKIHECFPLMKEDLDLAKLQSINFEQPIFYLDLAKKLSSEYEQKFGRKDIRYEKFNQFLLQSSLNAQLNDFLNPLNKKVKRYGFEKFFLIDKKYYDSYLPNVDFTEYPEFTFNAHTGISVSLENK